MIIYARFLSLKKKDFTELPASLNVRRFTLVYMFMTTTHNDVLNAIIASFCKKRILVSRLSSALQHA